MADQQPKTRTVKVEVEDPSLSAETNRKVTAEVREALEADEVQLPDERITHEGDDHPGGANFWSTLWSKRILLGMTCAMLLVVGGIVALATHAWVLLPVVFIVLVAVTLGVTYMFGETSTNVEKPSNSTLAAMEADGVPDAERLFNDHVQEFAGGGHRSRKEQLVHHDGSKQEDSTWQTAQQAALEQQTAWTPSSDSVAAGSDEEAPPPDSATRTG